MSTIDEIAQFFNESDDFCGGVRLQEPLAKRTTMHVGGNAALFLEPGDEDSLLFALRTLKACGAGYFVLGGGSNVIISDKGFSAAVISTRALHGVCVQAPASAAMAGDDGQCVTASAGAVWGRVLSFCKEHALGGLEAFTGLSGTVGGAVYMNATCFGLSACDRLRSVRYLDTASGEVREYVLTDEKRTTDWGYKRSPFQHSGSEEAAAPFVILSATFALSAGFDAEKAASCLESRKEKGHFRAPSAGSMFKNDTAHGVIAGKLIDDCGLKGFSVGGAQIAPWHGNIVINAGGATASDIKALVTHVADVVQERTGCRLESEVIFCGDWQANS